MEQVVERSFLQACSVLPRNSVVHGTFLINVQCHDLCDTGWVFYLSRIGYAWYCFCCNRVSESDIEHMAKERCVTVEDWISQIRDADCSRLGCCCWKSSASHEYCCSGVSASFSTWPSTLIRFCIRQVSLLMLTCIYSVSNLQRAMVSLVYYILGVRAVKDWWW